MKSYILTQDKFKRKSCHIKHELWYNSLTSDEKIIHLEKLNAEVIEFFNT